jgi:hypothetical protein
MTGSDVCEHGGLRRKCDTCDYREERDQAYDLLKRIAWAIETNNIDIPDVCHAIEEEIGEMIPPVGLTSFTAGQMKVLCEPQRLISISHWNGPFLLSAEMARDLLGILPKAIEIAEMPALERTRP